MSTYKSHLSYYPSRSDPLYQKFLTRSVEKSGVRSQTYCGVYYYKINKTTRHLNSKVLKDIHTIRN